MHLHLAFFTWTFPISSRFGRQRHTNVKLQSFFLFCWKIRGEKCKEELNTNVRAWYAKPWADARATYGSRYSPLERHAHGHARTFTCFAFSPGHEKERLLAVYLDWPSIFIWLDRLVEARRFMTFEFGGRKLCCGFNRKRFFIVFEMRLCCVDTNFLVNICHITRHAHRARHTHSHLEREWFLFICF